MVPTRGLAEASEAGTHAAHTQLGVAVSVRHRHLPILLRGTGLVKARVYGPRRLCDTPEMSSTEVIIRTATEADLPAINAIYNREILEGVATWDMEPWTQEARLAWFHEHTAPAEVVLVAEAGGEVVGFGYLARYRVRLGYRFTREDTLYIRPDFQRSGVGRSLLSALLDEARRAEMHVVVARIEAGNTGSIALHRSLGFEVVGEEHETGRKFDRWLSLVFMEVVLG